MARIQAKILVALERIFKYVPGERAPSDIDVELPVSVVEDISRIAIGGTGIGPWQHGWGYITDRHTHVAPGQITGNFIYTDPANTFQGMPDPFARDEIWPWIMGGAAEQDDVIDFLDAVIVLEPSGDAIAYSINAVPSPVNQVVLFTDIALSRGATISNCAIINQIKYPIPVVLRTGGGDARLLFASQSVVGGTVEIRMAMLHWFGTRYATPPGL